MINKQTKRLPPKYNVSLTVIKIMRDKQPTILHRSIAKNLYQNERHVNLVITDRSVGRKGLKSISNWSGSVISQVKDQWYERNLTDDQLRRILKKTFYP